MKLILKENQNGIRNEILYGKKKLHNPQPLRQPIVQDPLVTTYETIKEQLKNKGYRELKNIFS